MPVFTARRTLDAISLSVENAGSSNDAFTSISSATLIRSGESFLTSATDRTAASATARARCGSCLTKPLPHQPALPLPRVNRGERLRSLRQPQTTTNVLDNDLRDLSTPREVPQALETSERQNERQEVLIRPRPCPCPRHLVLGRAHESEILGRHQPPKPRVRRPLDRRHRTRPPVRSADPSARMLDPELEFRAGDRRVIKHVRL